MAAEQFVVVTPIKISRESYEPDTIVQFQAVTPDVERLVELGALRRIRQTQASEIVVHQAGAAQESVQSTGMPEAEQSFEQFVASGNEAQAYPPRGFSAQNTPAWRAYQAARTSPTLREAIPQRVSANVGFVPVVREIK